MLESEFTPSAFKDVRTNIIKIKCTSPNMDATEFRWKDYCPAVFRQIQSLKNVDHNEYMVTICADEILRQVALPGKAGRVIVLKDDDRFLIRTLRKSEAKMILSMLPNYFCHLEKNQTTLLSTMYGLHAVKPVGGLKIYFAIMSNIIPANVDLYKTFHLKGSSQGRSRSKIRLIDSVIHKDADFDLCFYLDQLVRDRLLQQIKRDCEFLETAGTMDYSLLIGIATQAPYQVSVDSSRSHHCKNLSRNFSMHSGDSRSSHSRSNTTDSVASPALTTSSGYTISSPSSSEDLEEFTSSNSNVESDGDVLELGMEMSARAIRTNMSKKGNISPGFATEMGCRNVLLYFSIVDIFQSYSMTKRIEHAYKSLQFDPKAISAVNPKLYSYRFQNLLGQIFQADSSKLMLTKDFAVCGEVDVKQENLWQRRPVNLKENPISCRRKTKKDDYCS